MVNNFLWWNWFYVIMIKFIKDVFKLNKNYEINNIVMIGVYEILYCKS